MRLSKTWPWQPFPVQVTGLSDAVEEVVAAGRYTCARTRDGTVWCWGDNISGELGDGTTQSPRTSPVQVIDLGSDVAELAAGGNHTCARVERASS